MRSVLDSFGEIFIKAVRDESIDVSDMIMTGKMRDNRLSEFMQLNNGENTDFQRALVARVVDITIGHFLWFLEKEDNLDLVFNVHGEPYSIKELSDGLKGEIFTEDGWIARFSEKRHFENE